MSKIPIVKLGKYIFEAREQIKSSDGNGFTVYGVTNTDGITITGKEASKDLSKYIQLKPKYFAYNPYRVNIGSIGLANENQDGIVSPAYVVFATKPELDPNYLFKYLKSYEGDQQINFYGNRGSVRKSLRFKELCNIEIPLPPLPEQQRIVKKIEKLISKIEEAKKLRNDIKLYIDSVNKSILEKFFDKNYETKKISELFNVTKLAGFEFTKYFEFTEKKEIIALRAKNVKNNGLKLNDIKYITHDLSNFLSRSKLFKNEIVMTFIGAGIGESAIIDEDNKYHLAPNVAKLTIKNKKQINPKFALAQIRSSFLQNQISNITRKTAQPCLSMEIIRNLLFKILPLEKQNSTVKYLNTIQPEIENLKNLQIETQTELNALIPSILNKAFKGEL